MDEVEDERSTKNQKCTKIVPTPISFPLLPGNKIWKCLGYMILEVFPIGYSPTENT